MFYLSPPFSLLCTEPTQIGVECRTGSRLFGGSYFLFNNFIPVASKGLMVSKDALDC